LTRSKTEFACKELTSESMTHLELFAEYRTLLFAQARRMLGSASDAEDLLQETFLHWQRTALRHIKSPRAFLITVVRNLCRNHLQSARVRHEDSIEALAPETLKLSPEQANDSLRESLATALRLVLERLPPKERLVFLLREVFDYEYEEIAKIIRKSVSNCRQMLGRARRHIASGHARFKVKPEQLENLKRQFASTCKSGDLRGLVALLSM
jgi:RNA polymerase sigma-70 factor, ECF subfamily